MSSVSISAGSKTCWSQSGSTIRYESNLGPTISLTSSGGGLVTSVSVSIGSTSVSNGKCIYPVTITLNYSIPSGYSETSSSSGATSATISGSATTQYGGVTGYFNVSKTVYYKKNGPTIYTITIYWTVNKGSKRYQNGDIIDSGFIGDVESGNAYYEDVSYDTII
jgi:hypothetical protein